MTTFIYPTRGHKHSGVFVVMLSEVTVSLQLCPPCLGTWKEKRTSPFVG